MRFQKRTAVLLVLLCALCLFVLPSCSAFSPKDKVSEDMSSRLDAIKEGDTGSLSVLAEDLDAEEVEGYGLSQDDLLAAYLDGFDYQIEDVSVDGKTASVSVVFTVKSYSEFISAFSETAFDIPLQDGAEDLSDEELYALFGDAILETLSSTSTGQTESVSFSYTKSDGEWEPDDFEQTIADALVSL